MQQEALSMPACRDTMADPVSSRREALAAAAALASLVSWRSVQPAQAQQDLDLTITERVSAAEAQLAAVV